jgi:hypothetical protein
MQNSFAVHKRGRKSRANTFSRFFWAYTAAVCKNHDLLTFAVGGMEDHIHLLFRLPPTGLAFLGATVTQGFRAWAKLVRALRRWDIEVLDGILLCERMGAGCSQC